MVTSGIGTSRCHPSRPELKPPAGLDKAIDEYRLTLSATYNSVETVFIPLDAEEERRSPVGAPSPQSDTVDQFANAEDLVGEDDVAENVDADEIDAVDDDGSDNDDEFRHETWSGGFRDLLRSEARCILLGDAGAGKTTCLLRLGTEASGGSRPDTKIFLFLPLASFREGDDLLMLIRRVSKFDAEQTDYLLRSNRLALLLDAVDECPKAAQAACVKSIRDLLASWPKLQLLVTGVSDEWRGQLNLPCFRLRPLDDGGKLPLLTARLGDVKLAQELLSRLGVHPAGALLSRTPHMLTILAQVAGQRGLPRGNTPCQANRDETSDQCRRVRQHDVSPRGSHADYARGGRSLHGDGRGPHRT